MNFAALQHDFLNQPARVQSAGATRRAEFCLELE